MRAFYASLEEGAGVGFYTEADWARIRSAYDLVTGSCVLDVGVGNGALLQVLSRSRRFEPVAGVDIRRHSKLQLPVDVDFHLMSVASLDFADDEFDTVVCMEVLEHLEAPDLEPAIAELRRVARSRLVMTVPLNEPHPLWWHDKPGGHRQQFDPDRIRRLFPDALALLQPRPGSVDWLFLVEDTAATRRLQPVVAVLDGYARVEPA